MENTNNQISLINYLKAIAIIFIVVIHCNFPLYYKANNVLFHYVINLAVPLFLIIMGYNTANSYVKKGWDTLKKLYNFKYLFKKTVDFSAPFLLAWLLFVFMGNPQLFIYGKGFYYYFIVLEFIFLMPIMYLTVKKFVPSFYGVGVWFLAGFVWELLLATGVIKLFIYGAYSYYCFRYLFFVAIGMYLALNKNQIKPYWLIGSFVLGFLYVYNFDMYTNFIFPWYAGIWANTAAPVGFYLFPVLYILLRYLKDFKIPGWAGRLFETIGKASWHIFIMQMVYFLNYPDKMGMWSIRKLDVVVICCSCGILYYLFMNIIKREINSYILSHKKKPS